VKITGLYIFMRKICLQRVGRWFTKFEMASGNDNKFRVKGWVCLIKRWYRHLLLLVL
jgi:hypothetical protein